MVIEGKTGRILAGQSPGWYIRVEKDEIETGGFYIYTCKNADLTGAWGETFDDWVPDWDGVLAYFADPELEIDWDFDTRH